MFVANYIYIYGFLIYSWLLIFKVIEIFNVHDVVITYAVHAIAANKYPIG